MNEPWALPIYSSPRGRPSARGQGREGAKQKLARRAARPDIALDTIPPAFRIPMLYEAVRFCKTKVLVQAFTRLRQHLPLV
jgi:hypothetical protein